MGNIYEDADIFADKDIARLVQENPAVEAPMEDQYIATSSKVNKNELKSEAHA